MKKFCWRRPAEGRQNFLKQELEHDREQKANKNEKFAGNGCLKGSKNVIILGYKQKRLT